MILIYWTRGRGTTVASDAEDFFTQMWQSHKNLTQESTLDEYLINFKRRIFNLYNVKLTGETYDEIFNELEYHNIILFTYIN